MRGGRVVVRGVTGGGGMGRGGGRWGGMEGRGGRGRGMNGRGEWISIRIVGGGVREKIRRNGGSDWMHERMTRRISGRRGAEGTIAGLVCLANLCTANNTIAILTVGPIARSIADRFGVSRRRSASLLDTFSCFTQGLLPYAAQLLMAAGLAGLSSLEISRYPYYSIPLGVVTLLAILLPYPRQD